MSKAKIEIAEAEERMENAHLAMSRVLARKKEALDSAGELSEAQVGRRRARA